MAVGSGCLAGCLGPWKPPPGELITGECKTSERKRCFARVQQISTDPEGALSTTTSLPITSPLCTHQLQTGPASLQRQMSLISSCQNCKSWEKEGEKRAWLLPAGKQACSLQHRLGCAVCEGSQHMHQPKGVWSTLGRCTGEMGQWPQASHRVPAPALPPPAQCHRAAPAVPAHSCAEGV